MKGLKSADSRPEIVKPQLDWTIDCFLTAAAMAGLLLYFGLKVAVIFG